MILYDYKFTVPHPLQQSHLNMARQIYYHTHIVNIIACDCGEVPRSGLDDGPGPQGSWEYDGVGAIVVSKVTLRVV